MKFSSYLLLCIISRSNYKPYLTSSVSVSSPLVQMTDSFRDSITSLASHLSFSALPAFRCLSLDTARPESSVIVNSGAAIENTPSTILLVLHILPSLRNAYRIFLRGGKKKKRKKLIILENIKDKRTREYIFSSSLCF